MIIQYNEFQQAKSYTFLMVVHLLMLHCPEGDNMAIDENKIKSIGRTWSN